MTHRCILNNQDTPVKNNNWVKYNKINKVFTKEVLTYFDFCRCVFCYNFNPVGKDGKNLKNEEKEEPKQQNTPAN